MMNNTGTEAAGALFGFLFMGFFGLLYLFIIGLGIVAFIFWIFMLIDVAKRDFKDPNQRTTWILVVALAGWIGGLIYYFVVKAKDPKHHSKS